MYTLREFYNNGIERNTYLGNEYICIHKVENKEDYENLCKAFNYGDDVIGFILARGETIPLYGKSKYYVMIGGQTFSTIRG